MKKAPYLENGPNTSGMSSREETSMKQVPSSVLMLLLHAYNESGRHIWLMPLVTKWEESDKGWSTHNAVFGKKQDS